MDKIISDRIDEVNTDTRVSEFIDDKISWKVDILTRYLLEDIIYQIKNTPIPLSNIEVKICWNFTPTGIFSVRSATCANNTIIRTKRLNLLITYGAYI